MENQLHVDRKITNFNRKTNATFILPSNDFQDSQTKRERERERARARAHSSHGPKPRSRLTSAKLWPAQIMPPHCPDHAPAKLPLFSLFFLNVAAIQIGVLHLVLVVTTQDQSRCPPLKIVAAAKDRSLFPDLSFFPSISQSFSL